MWFAGGSNAGGYGVKLVTHDQKWLTIYWHFTPQIVVQKREEVRAGDLIGYADTTGIATGSHLHFGLMPLIYLDSNGYTSLNKDNGYKGYIDPLPYFMKYIINKQNNQALVLENIKIVLEIGNEAVLKELQKQGLDGYPSKEEYPQGYTVFPLVSKEIIKDIFNL